MHRIGKVEMSFLTPPRPVMVVLVFMLLGFAVIGCRSNAEAIPISDLVFSDTRLRECVLQSTMLQGQVDSEEVTSLMCRSSDIVSLNPNYSSS